MSESKLPAGRQSATISTQHHNAAAKQSSSGPVTYSNNIHNYVASSKGEPSNSQVQQYKTVQIISQPNHVMSNSGGNCVLVQQVSNSNHSISFQPLNNSQVTAHGSQPSQRVYRQNSNTTYVNSSRAVNANDSSRVTIAADSSQIQVQNSQVPAQYTSQIQLQDGRQVQMIQLNNTPYYVNTAQNGQQQITIQQYVPQQQFVSNNGQSVLVASQNQDGSRTIQTLPAQLHAIQHSVSPQNQSFHISKNSKTVKGNQQVLQITSNGAQFAGQQGSPVYHKIQTTQIRPATQRTRQKVTPTKSRAPKSVVQAPRFQQPLSTAGPSTAMPQQAQTSSKVQTSEPPATTANNKTLPPKQSSLDASISMPPPPLPVTHPSAQKTSQNSITVVASKSPAKKALSQSSSQVTYQKVVYNNVVRPAQAGASSIRVYTTVPQKGAVQASKSVAEQQQNQKIHQILQTAKAQQQNSMPPPPLPKHLTAAGRTPGIIKPTQYAVPSMVPRNQVIMPSPMQSTSQMKLSGMKQFTVPAVSQQAQRPQVPIVPAPIKPKAPQVKKIIPVVTIKSPVPTDPSHNLVGKLNIDLAVGDPKESYRTLKRHFKYLVYENECYQGHLRDSHQKLLKLERDNNYLMDRLLKYENVSDSDGEESDSSVKTIEDKVVLQKPTKRKQSAKAAVNAPPRKKANIVAKNVPVGSTASPAKTTISRSTASTSAPSTTAVASTSAVSSKTTTATTTKTVAKVAQTKPTVTQPVIFITPALPTTVSSAPSTKAATPSTSSAPTAKANAKVPAKSIVKKLSPEQIAAIKKEGKLVKSVSALPFPHTIKANVKKEGAAISLKPVSAPVKSTPIIPNPIVQKSDATFPKAGVLKSAVNGPSPIKRVITTRIAPPKATVEIKELPMKAPLIRKELRPRQLIHSFIRPNTGSEGVPKVFMPMIMQRNPTPQARASISYSAIKSPVSRMVGPGGAPRMVRGTRFSIVTPPTMVMPHIIKPDLPKVDQSQSKDNTSNKTTATKTVTTPTKQPTEPTSSSQSVSSSS